MRFQILIVLSLLMLFAACDKDPVNEAPPNTPTVLSGETVSANFFGQLTNDLGEAVEGASVSIGSTSTTTDQEGLWSIDNASVVKDQAFIQFAAESHHKGSRTLLVEDGAKYEVDLQMLQYSGAETVDASTGGMVSVPNSDASVTFPSGAFAKTDGTPYTGTVRVETAYLDPNEASTASRMPGDLRATTATGDSRLLITYGMVSVELFDDAGNELQLADGQTATISLPVEGEAANTAPATIPLWYFDETTAQWIEEGSATLQNGSYVGEVSHFTFWNCDIPTEYIRLCGAVVFEGVDSTTAANLRLVIESQNWGNGYGYTDSNGQFCGIVPANETLTLLIYGGACNTPTFSVTIGPYATDTDLGTIIIPLPQNLLTTVSGTANCNGNPLTSGAVRIYQNGEILTTTTVDATGSFMTNFISCDPTDITVRVINYATLEEGEVTFGYSSSITTGDIAACNSVLTEYIEITVNGTTSYGDDINHFGGLDFFYMNGNTDASYGRSYIDFSTGATSFPSAEGVFRVELEAPRQSLILVVSPLITTGALFSRSPFDLTITSSATPTNPYTVGQMGPFTETVTDSTGTDVDYIIQINFSAFTQL
ncbi:MAG: hypothetical protein AB8F78_03170 [Saprospiraceae bacterium]